MYHEVIDTLDIFPIEADFFLSYSIVLLVKNLETSLTVADLMDVFPEDEVAVDLETRGVHHEVHRGAVSPLVQLLDENLLELLDCSSPPHLAIVTS